MHLGNKASSSRRRPFRAEGRRTARPSDLPRPVYDELKHNALIQEALTQLHELTGLTAKLCRPVCPKSKIQFGGRDAPFCRQVAAFSGGCPVCLRLQTQLLHRLEGKLKPHQLCCPAGIIHLAVPVVVAGNHVATIVGGSVRLKLPSAARFACCCRQLGLDEHNGRLRLLRRAFFSTPTLTPSELAAALRLLQTLAQLFALAPRHLEAGKAPVPEPARVAAVKRFVGDHLAACSTSPPDKPFTNIWRRCAWRPPKGRWPGRCSRSVKLLLRRASSPSRISTGSSNTKRK
jgi:ligand-binding sensor protein